MQLAFSYPTLAAATEFQTPLIRQRADPHVVLHTDGWYYFMGTVPEYDRLELRRARTIAELPAAEAKTIWRKHDTGPMGAHIWAPEIHHIDGRWFIYFSAGEAEKVWNIRLYVLENSSGNPLEGEWIERGQLKTGWETFSLDATTFAHRGTRYLVWTQRPVDVKDTCIYLARMDGPTSITGPVVMLTKPEFDWEIVRFRVNEGPAILLRHGRVFLTYSASGTGAEYCVGLLTADENANLLDPQSWTKSPEPVFRTSEENRIFGPGHNSFTTTPDGATDLLVYHARSYRDIEGDPLRDPNRHTRVQELGWKADGTPDFGVPVPDSLPKFGTVKRADLRARDACIWPDPATQTYHMYFSVAQRGPNRRAAVAAYTSKDLENWTGPNIVFEVPPEFWADRGIWAPEMQVYGGKYYLFLTFDSAHKLPEQWRNWLPRVKRGSQVLVADSPLGPFLPFANRPHTPEDMMTLDGTLWIEDGVPWMIYLPRVGADQGRHRGDDPVDGRSVGNGRRTGSPLPRQRRSVELEVAAVRLPRHRWSLVVSHERRETSDALVQSGTASGYAVGIAESTTGKLAGPWQQREKPLFDADGGHPMLFRRFDGQLMLALHQPNKPPREREVFLEIDEVGDDLRLKAP